MWKNATITGNILQEMAATFWAKLPQYTDQEQPKFSLGWLEDFKNRYRIKKYRRHGESGSVDQVVVEAELEDLREKLRPYENQDIYNIDESALF